MDAIFQVGHVVRLKSGGPEMTVTSIAKDGKVNCQWWWDGKYDHGSFPPDAIQR